MSAFSLDDPAMIRQFTQIYLQSKPVQVQTKDEARDDTKGQDEKAIEASSDLPSEDQSQSYEDQVEPSVPYGHDQTESHDRADHLSHHTSENSVCGDQQSDRTALSDHAENMSYQSSVESVLLDQRSDRTALSDQIDGQSVRSDEQFYRANEQSDPEDSQSNNNFQQFTQPSEPCDHADEQSDHADTQFNHTYQQSTHANELSDDAYPPYRKDLDSEISSRIRHQATQTEPVNIYSPQIPKMIHSNTKAESLNSSATGSPSTTLSEAVASQSSDTKGKSAIDSVLLMSPKLSGILPPPSTPEAQPDLNGTGISKLIISELEGRKPLSMGESRHAPRTSGSYGRFQPFRMTSKSTESVTGKGSDLESGGSEISNPLFKTVADDYDNPKLSSLPDSTESLRWDTPSPSKPGSGATVLATTSPLTNDAINDDEKSTNGNSVDDGSAKDKFADDNKSVDDKSDDSKSVDNESINKESVNGSSRESKSAENEFIDSNLFDDSGVNDKPAHGKSVNSKSVGGGTVRKGTHLPPHLRHLESSVQGPYEDHINEGRLVDQSHTAETIQQDQIVAGTTNGRSGKRPNIVISTANSPHPYADGTVGFDLTPSSVIFHAVSPPPNACLEDEDRTELAFFGQWGKPEARTTAAAKVRKVIIRIPDANPSFIASLVWGGMIDEIIIKTKSAEVIFASAEDCDKYYDIGRKGIPYKRKGSDKAQFAFVDKGPDVNVVGGLLQTYLDQGFTRCVRVTNVPDEFTKPQLQVKAGLKGRRLEGIEDGNLSTGLRYVVFRFCTIAFAVQFKKALEREEEWEHCNICYSPDPCASSTRLESLPGA